LDASHSVKVRRHLEKENISGLKKFLRGIEIGKRLKRRYIIDKEKYWRLYKVRYNRPELYYNLVLDTSSMNEQETFNLILKKIEDGGYIKE